MARNIVLVCLLLLVLAAAIYVVDLCLSAVMNRLQIADDIKRAVRAVLCFIVFVIALMFVLNLFGFLPAGWW